MPDVPKYDGTSDPQEHITTYTTTVKGNDLALHEIESILLKKFGETLTRGSLTWYLLLPEHSINSFEMLTDSFIKAHAGARKVQARKPNIFRIAQGEFELLREFVTQFQKERMLLPVVPDEWADEAFTKGLNPRSLDASQKLKESLLEFQDKETSDTRDPSYPRLSEYNFNFSVVELVSAIRIIKEARFSKPRRFKPSQRDPNLWCKYYGTDGHRTGDCQHLREEVATLLKNGHLREFLSDRAKNNYGRNCDNAKPSKGGDYPPCQTINMIFGEGGGGTRSIESPSRSKKDEDINNP
ncbi:PREDICTED: uncharacterized protein LOC109241569 [Nicotiana attenuata]|uniref:uncharacterized protein LOC109241569 n=1 Tax=Nicotiana attenuata TaxID=49451 RepID=UPI00090500D4|nr:PREDICTED: uncharacterized protein LOC109241569 [Nicotiana attenuata]